MNIDNFVEECILKKDERQTIIVIKNPKNNERFIKRVINDDKRYIYKNLQKITHSNIPRIIDIKLTDSTIIIEEFVEGTSLSDLMENHYRFTYKQIKSIANQLVSAMSELHKYNIIHRDIKPDNIIINQYGHVWLIDYDIARIYNNEMRKDTTVLGTVGYAPVEQFGMMPTDYKTDIYAFGATISQLLEYSKKKGSLHRISQKCKRFDPAQRYQSTKQLKRALSFNFVNTINICICVLLIIFVIFGCIYISNGNEQKENYYNEYLGTWRDDNGIILEMLNINGNEVRFNIKSLQPNGSIRSIDNVTGIINGGKIEFSSIITDFGDSADGVLTLENDCIYVDVYTENMNTSSSITAATIVTKDISVNVNGMPVQFAENPPIILDNNIFVPANDFPRALKLDSYYDSGFWAGDSETRITIMNSDTIIFFTSYDNTTWSLYTTQDENIQNSYINEYEQIPVTVSQQPTVFNDTVYIPLQILVEQFGAEMVYDKDTRTIDIKADTSTNCKSEVEIKMIEDFDSERAYDIARLKYNNLLQTDGMPHYNHKGKFFMFITGENTVAYVYDSGVIEIN